MAAQIVLLAGKRYVILPENEYAAMRRGVAGDVPLPELPEADKNGSRPAVATCTAVIAQQIIKRRWAAMLTQRELARRAGVRVETLCRIERGRNVPEEETVRKIDRALKMAEKQSKRKRPVRSEIARVRPRRAMATA
jgi:DNA-binding XRE family transcriptional regulator